MYTNTRFQDFLKGLSFLRLNQIRHQHKADKFSKGFGFKQHLEGMLFAQVSGAKSLRELEQSYQGVSCRKLARSTLADANRLRNPEPFREVAQRLMALTNRATRRKVKQQLYVIDSSPISARGRGYDQWTSLDAIRSVRGFKLHLHLDLNHQQPVYFQLSSPNINDIVDARQHVVIEKQATYIADKAYNDYNWWWQINQAGAFFVTRIKTNAAYEVRCSRPCDAPQIMSDETIVLTNRSPGGGRKNNYAGHQLRRVVVLRDDGVTPLELITNDFRRSAAEIGALYRARWQIELFFKKFKQNLKIKTFLGQSRNAVMIQIYVAMIAYLLMTLQRVREGITAPLNHYLAELRVSLLCRPLTEYRIYRRRIREALALSRMQTELAL